jgi:predicted TPR repeat methyltransferase
MLSSEKAMRDAMVAHKAGRLTSAEVGYRRVLRSKPEDPKALYYLGLLHYHRGELEAGLKYVMQCLQHAPTHGIAWNTLGSMYVFAKRHEEAKAAYTKAVEVTPDNAEAWYNLGICLRDEGDMEGAVEKLREAMARQRNFFQAYGALAVLLYRLGRVEKAAEMYRLWSLRDPENVYASYMAAATSGEQAPSRAPDEFIQKFFDVYAPEFDKSLGRLNYRAPEIVARALREATQGHPDLDVLDAGCGTGLCGSLVRSQCRSLVGVDLSTKMLDEARARGGYDKLINAEICAFMRTHPDDFDAIVAADTLVYFGELGEPLTAAHTALRPAGWLVFTLEARNADDSTDHRLEAHGRYTHGEDYLQRILMATGFDLVSRSREILRQESMQDVVGHLVIARRQ